MTGSASAARPSLDPRPGSGPGTHPATTPRRLARTAGALYLVNIVLGAFAIGLVPGMLFVSDDLAKTAHDIQAHEALYRLSLAAHVVVTLTNVPMALLFYELFKVVSRRLALLDVFFTLVATAVETATIPNEFTPLAFLHGKTYTGALSTAQMPALEHLPNDLDPTPRPDRRGVTLPLAADRRSGHRTLAPTRSRGGDYLMSRPPRQRLRSPG